MKIGDTLAAIDYYADCIPGLSTVTNLVDLFEKCVVLPFMEKTTVKGNHYFSHVSYKSTVNSLALLIPGLNIVVFICRSINWESNKNYMMWKVRENGLFLQGASESLKNDKDVVLAAVKNFAPALMYAGDEPRNDRTIVKAAVSQDGRTIEYAHSQFLEDEEVVLAAVTQEGEVLGKVDRSFRKNKKVVRAALRSSGAALRFLGKAFRADWELVLIAVKKNGGAVKYASENLKKDEEVGIAVVQSGGYLTFEINRGKELLDKSLRDSARVMLAAIQFDIETFEGKALSFEHASERLKNDEKFVGDVVELDGRVLEHASEEIRDNDVVVLAAVKQNPEAFQFASERLKGDEKFVKKLLKRNGMILELVSEELKNNLILVRLASGQNPEAFQFASEKGIRGDKDRIKEFLKKNGLNLKYATEEIQDDIASVRIAFTQNRDALRFASERVRKILVKKDNSTEGDE